MEWNCGEKLGFDAGFEVEGAVGDVGDRCADDAIEGCVCVVGESGGDGEPGEGGCVCECASEFGGD